MKIKLVTAILGTRNGAEWPKPGVVFDLPDDEARTLLANGQAVEAIDEEVGAAPRGAKPYEAVGLSQGDYPDVTGRTGPALVDQVGEVTDAGITVNADHLSAENRGEGETDEPVVPEDATVTPPVNGDEVRSATVEAPEDTAARTGKARSNKSK